ncbi:OsmC family protein [Pontibacter harenae]|uniref:OsmC family protein n=1 Tax=Pontibacter harenae TaxID=2894083 RepID=UPI001E53732A|nr:OsmC family protein [Pontibacter harenae]MCC9168119.1 OsmC family protein [Pontibacter harenae]
MSEISRGVTVSADKGSGMMAQIVMEGQPFKIDESGAAEGVKNGPDPNDYILSALGACTVITLHMYASRKQWPLERAEVLLRHEFVVVDNAPGLAAGKIKKMLIYKHLRLLGDLTPEQIKRLLNISSKCPVQKTLEAGVMVETILEV